jgi:hypothetical protein
MAGTRLRIGGTKGDEASRCYGLYPQVRQRSTSFRSAEVVAVISPAVGGGSRPEVTASAKRPSTGATRSYVSKSRSSGAPFRDVPRRALEWQERHFGITIIGKTSFVKVGASLQGSRDGLVPQEDAATNIAIALRSARRIARSA